MRALRRAACAALVCLSQTAFEGDAPAAQSAGAPPRRPPPPAAEALRQERAELEKLLRALGEHSERYQQGLLRFVCEETLILSEFDTGSGRRQKERAERYDYLLARSRSGRIVERRRKLDERGPGAWASVSLEQPEPYLWSLLFSPHYQRLFNYRLAGQEVVRFRLATVIEFDAILPFVDGSEVTQWAGRAYVDAESLDLLRIEAEPSGQQIRLDAAAQEYHQAFRIIGVPLKRRPRVHLHEVDFDYERDGLRLPSLSITRRYTSTDAVQRSLKSQAMQIFTDYRLFRVETDEKLKEIRGPDPP